MGRRIVLVADKTLMSSYNGSMFIGFAACFPRVLPKWLYTKLFCPREDTEKGAAKSAPAGIRKIEATLRQAGIAGGSIAVAHPDRLSMLIDSDTRVIGITTSDPMGMGPASSTFSSLLERESYTAYFFRRLLGDLHAIAPQAKLIVGGPGAWQLSDEATRRSLGIDCLVEGEGELVAPELFRNAVEGRPIPSTVSGMTVPIENIPAIMGPTINGTVEISRGCGRGCEFCNPNMRTVRHFPTERILEEVSLNLQHKDKITLHAEDVLRWKAKSMRPDREAVTHLFSQVQKLTDNVGMSHIALSSALSEPRLIEELSRITGVDTGRKHLYAQTGIETGSPELVSKHMRGKAKPFEPEKWPEVVKETFKLLSSNNWVTCGTLVMGMPGETQRDVQLTLDLVKDLREYKSFIVPLFFVPLGDLKEDAFFRPDEMHPEHWMLLGECIDHDFYWATNLMDELFAQNKMSATKSTAMKMAAWYMKRRLKEPLALMKEGRDPRKSEQPEFGNNGGYPERQAGEA